MKWYVVYTKPKWKKRAAKQLTKFGVNCYCPLIKKTQQRSDRKIRVEVPLFNHYIFVQLAEKDRNIIFNSPGVVRYLFWLGTHAVVKDKEIETIKEWLTSDDSATEISVMQYQIGQKIKLDSGPFCEQNAFVKDITKTHYVLILESLGYVLKVKNK
ncbi:UpxY family transcription antiterminator [Flavobacterium cellulosilyticum]|uniref:UpxY family transcription antiterminator n=1 Tax=Flavobacterium cellulosilyticum TaxID=2541731 RepID=A0A4R5C4A1_9FLAO|nr:UpxY family transcription antiterminator [Flavobacterium cellulosilyticum]TDD93419.1 UpxY family transcription antiterminator [Flavobacterium cellulosilyticum]